MKHLTTLIVIAILISTTVTAAGTREPAKTPERASVLPAYTIRGGALKGPTGIGMIHLFETVPELPQNSSFQMEAVASADAMTAKLLSGELDVAVLPVNLAAKLYNSGIAYHMTAVSGNGMVQLVTSNPAIGKLADLKGKTIHVAGQAATPDFLLRALLKKQQIDPNTDLNLSYQLPIPEIAASLIAGRIDTAVLPEPFVSMVLAGNQALSIPFSLTVLWEQLSGSPDYPMSVVVVRTKLQQDRPQAVAALMAAYRASIMEVMADPASAGQLVEKHDMGLRANVASAAIPKSNYVFIPADAARPAVEQLLKIFLEYMPASIGGKLPDSAFYQAAF